MLKAREQKPSSSSLQASLDVAKKFHKLWKDDIVYGFTKVETAVNEVVAKLERVDAACGGTPKTPREDAGEAELKGEYTDKVKAIVRGVLSFAHYTTKRLIFAEAEKVLGDREKLLTGVLAKAETEEVLGVHTKGLKTCEGTAQSVVSAEDEEI